MPCSPDDGCAESVAVSEAVGSHSAPASGGSAPRVRRRPAAGRRFRPQGLALAVAVLGLSGPVGALGQVAPPRLELAASSRTDGHLTLAWGPGDPADDREWEFEVQRSTAAGFESPLACYVGPDRSTFLSGLPAGAHSFRARARHTGSEDWSPWSPPISFEIAPYSLAAAWSVFGLGAVLVVSIVGYLVAAERRARKLGAGS